MIHIVFQHADVKVLNQAMELDETLKGDVLEIKDEWGVGPLNGLDTEEGWKSREDWWRLLLKDSPYGEQHAGSFDDRETVQKLKETLTADTELQAWIWMGQNQHDVTGYYWLMPQLREFQGRLMIVYLNNLPFINEKGQLFYPLSVHDILPKEAVKAKKLARPITLSEFEVDPDEWTKLCNENKGVRLLEGGKKLVQEDYDFYDAELKKFITPDWQKASRIIHHFLSKAKHTTGDMYLLWRLKVMIAMDMFDVQGKIANMKDFEIKLKVS